MYQRIVARWISVFSVLLAFTAILPTIGHAVQPTGSAAAPIQTYLPVVMRPAPPTPPARYIGLAIDQTSLQQYDANIKNFQNLTGTHLGVIHMPAVWSAVDFYDLKPLLNFIVRNGSTPLVQWEPWAGLGAGFGPNNCQATYSLQNILDGKFDTYIRTFARNAAEWNHTFLMVVGQEFNVNQAAWSGWCNGRAAGGPEKFKQTFIRLHTIFNEEGATNIKWVWTPNSGSFPNEPWNDANNYYPGDDVVDWIGTNAFNWGASSTFNQGGRWLTMNEIAGSMLDYMNQTHPSKPIILTEAGSIDGDGGTQAAWISDALASAAARTQIRAFTYYNYNLGVYPVDHRVYDTTINSRPAAVQAFREGVAQQSFNQYFYEGTSATPISVQPGTGAGLGVGIYEPLYANVQAFEQLAQKKVGYVLIYYNFGSAHFDPNPFNQVSTGGATPVVRWTPDGISLAQINNGTYDNYITQWAQAAHNLGKPFYLAWAPEPNNNFFPTAWAGSSNGGAAGGAQAYVAAWQRIHAIFTQQGATNVKWLWMPYHEDMMPQSFYATPIRWQREDSRWNFYYNYYPGDSYVDAVGFLVTNNDDNVATGEYWRPPFLLLDNALNATARSYPDKPQFAIITSVESASDPNRKAAWITESYAFFKHYKNVQAVIWQNATPDTRNWPINSSSAALAAFQAAVADSYYRTTP